MPDLPVYSVRTGNERLPPAGFDSSIASVPKGVFAQVDDGPPALDVRLLGRVLRQISEQQAADIGEQLHHAEWVITADPAEVEKRGIHPDHPDCARCRASIDQALAYLAEHNQPLLVGTLCWAQQ